MVLLPLSCLLFSASFYLALKADEGEKEAIDAAKKFIRSQNQWRGQVSLIAVIFATGTALYFGWIMTAVMFTTAKIIALPAKGLMQRAARCEPSFGDETIDALRQDAEG